MSHIIHTIYLLVGCFGGLGMIVSLAGAMTEARASSIWVNLMLGFMILCIADILFGIGAILVHLL